MKKILLVFLILGSFISYNNAAHIVGGDITYKCKQLDLANNKVSFRIRANIYRDNVGNGAEFDNPAEFGVYVKNGNNWVWIETHKVNLGQDVELDIINPNPCLDVPENVGVDEGVYFFDIDLDIVSQPYMILYQRCCRNQSITNIKDPGDAGAGFSIEISPEAQLTCNNSPVFNGFPPIVICANDPLNFDHSASDAEGDLIQYEFCAPISAGGPRGGTGGPGATACDGVKPNPENCPPLEETVEYVAGYTALNPILSNPVVSIDKLTGLITGTPIAEGQYVVGVCAKEYRAGILIGEIRRDFQFNVAKCDPLVYAKIGTGDEIQDQLYDIIRCGINTVNIQNESYLESNIDEYSWEFYLGSDTIRRNTKDVFISFPDLGDYEGQLILNPGTQCADTADVLIHIYPGINADFEMEYDTCIPGSIEIQDLSHTGSLQLESWNWQMHTDTTLDVQNPSYEFEEPGSKNISLIVTDDNGCMDTLTKVVEYFPTPTLLEVNPSHYIGCAPGSVYFDNVSSPLDSTYTFIWDFGDGTINDGHDISPSHLYDTPGQYTVTLDVISPIGCEVGITLPSTITIKEKPFADFEYNPEDPTIFNNEVQFTNLSEGEVGYNWNYDGAGVFSEENPFVIFQDTGTYNVRLIVINEEHCTDTATATLHVIAPVILHFPNAFTPNNDALNETFLPEGYYDVVKDYKLNIFNRWGELIFESDDPAIGWNGQKHNSGQLSPIGVYIFQATYTDEYKKAQKIDGHINLIR